MVTGGSGPYGAHWLVTGPLTDDALLDAASDLGTGARPQ
jgi:hypothetical protein